MPWSFVGGISSLTNAVTRSVAVGNLLVFGHTYGDSATPPTVSDTAGNVWTPVLSGVMIRDTVNGQDAAMWWAIAKSTASITVTAVSTGTFANSNLAEYSNADGTMSADGNGTGTANIPGSTSPNGQATGSVTTTRDGDLVVSYIVDDGAADAVTQFAAGTSFTKRTTASMDPGGAGVTTSAWEDATQTSAGAINPTWTATASHPAVGITAAFKVLAATRPPQRDSRLAIQQRMR